MMNLQYGCVFKVNGCEYINSLCFLLFFVILQARSGRRNSSQSRLSKTSKHVVVEIGINEGLKIQ